jgi:hypothetical protein
MVENEWKRWRYGLTPDEENEILDAFVEELLKDKEKSRALFVEAGIYNPDGTLTDQYKTPEVIPQEYLFDDV